MADTAIVKIWGQTVGAIAWDETQGFGSFEFEKSFTYGNLDLSPIKLPLSEARQRIFSFVELRNSTTFKGLPGLLADALPDKYGNALMDTWLSRNGRPSGSMNPVEQLCFIGKRGMGALEFEPAIPKTPNTSTKIEISNLVQIANEILTGRQDFSTNLSKNEEKALLDILKIGTSAGGARAKALIAYNSITHEVRSGQADAPDGFTHWLIKFDGVTDSQFGTSTGYGRVEMAYHLMAKAAGIEMTECRLLEENGRAHFMTQRFDRKANKEKIHLQSFCALQHYDFNEINLYSYEQLFETMRILGLPYPQAEQLFRRMVFNVIARNCDDHTKNFAFMMDTNGVWKLSPAFDVCHSYRPGSTWVSQQSLSVNGKRKDIGRDDLLAVAKQMNIKKAPHLITELTEIINNWNEYADEAKVNVVLRDAIDKTLIKHIR
jgi:serine/threonine-protein kinase HipA